MRRRHNHGKRCGYAAIVGVNAVAHMDGMARCVGAAGGNVRAHDAGAVGGSDGYAPAGVAIASVGDDRLRRSEAETRQQQYSNYPPKRTHVLVG